MTSAPLRTATELIRQPGPHRRIGGRDSRRASTRNSLAEWACIGSFVFVCLFGALPVADAKTQLSEEERRQGFVSMFDGKSLKGWSVTPSKAAKAWSVSDDAIVGVGDKGRSYLVYENHKISDFEMKLRYRFPEKEGNSGVNIRAIPDPTGRRGFQSYHADFGHLGIGRQVLGAWDFHTPGREEHRCWRGERLVIDANDEPTITKIDGAVTRDDILEGQWNEVHIIAKGNHFQFAINGKPAAEFTEYLPDKKRLHKGMIQLQLHDPGMIVQFKDLRIKILK